MADITPKAPPELEIPLSSHTVSVRVIDTTTRMICNAESFVHPVIENHERLNLAAFCFLIEHESSNGKEFGIYDSGARKDLDTMPPRTREMIQGHVPAVEVAYGVDEILTRGGLDLSR